MLGLLPGGMVANCSGRSRALTEPSRRLTPHAPAPLAPLISPTRCIIKCSGPQSRQIMRPAGRGRDEWTWRAALHTAHSLLVLASSTVDARNGSRGELHGPPKRQIAHAGRRPALVGVTLCADDAAAEGGRARTALPAPPRRWTPRPRRRLKKRSRGAGDADQRDGSVKSVAWSPDGSASLHGLVGSKDGKVAVYEVAAGPSREFEHAAAPARMRCGLRV